MSTFSDWNGPQTGPSVNAIAKFATEYEKMRGEFEAHKEETVKDAGLDIHGTRTYVESKLQPVKNKANDSFIAVKQILAALANVPETQVPLSLNNLATYFKERLDNKDIVSCILALKDRVSALESELNTLSLIQFDNVPVGAGIRWYKETLPEDGTYVWANGQTLYGVNQNFPELARVWELDGSDNVIVPMEDHTIFKVRRATVKIKPIEHAYIDEAPAQTPRDYTEIAQELSSLSTALAALQQTVEGLGATTSTNP